MTDHADHPESFSPILGAAPVVPDSAFPSEAFACPYCGQMLGAACRVCVSCKRAINPTEIRKAAPILEPAEPQSHVAIAPARFSWPIFFIVLGISWIAATISLQVFGLDKSKVMIGMLQIISAAWVFFDALEKRVPKPLRWGLGSLFLWILFFPWYLARRRTPHAPVPFIEGQASPLARVLLVALALFFLVGLVFTIVRGAV